jgi:hypothetical protein
MAQSVSRQPPAAEAWVRSRTSACGNCCGQSGNGTGFSPNTSVFPWQFHSTGVPLHGKTKKLIIFVTGLHNKPQGCGASVASAAGPFTKKKVILYFNPLPPPSGPSRPVIGRTLPFTLYGFCLVDDLMLSPCFICRCTSCFWFQRCLCQTQSDELNFSSYRFCTTSTIQESQMQI